MGNRIAELREAKGLSQRQLAQLVGTSGQQIGHLEAGRRSLTAHWMERIAAALGCNPRDLIDGNHPLGEELGLSPRERAMLDLFRQLPADEQSRLMKVASALAQPSDDDEKSNDGTHG